MTDRPVARTVISGCADGQIKVERETVHGRHHMPGQFRLVRTGMYITNDLTKRPGGLVSWWILDVVNRAIEAAAAGPQPAPVPVIFVPYPMPPIQDRLEDAMAKLSSYLVPTDEELEALNHVLTVAAATYGEGRTHILTPHGAAHCSQCSTAEKWWQRMYWERDEVRKLIKHEGMVINITYAPERDRTLDDPETWRGIGEEVEAPAIAEFIEANKAAALAELDEQVVTLDLPPTGTAEAGIAMKEILLTQAHDQSGTRHTDGFLCNKEHPVEPEQADALKDHGGCA